jgi:hypothetical protein
VETFDPVEFPKNITLRSIFGNFFIQDACALFVFVLSLPVLIILSISPLRFLTGLAWQTCLLLSSGFFVALLLYAGWRSRACLTWQVARRFLLTTTYVGVVVAVCSCWISQILSIPEMSDFPQVGGGDGGNHIFQMRMFLFFDPKHYEGMTSLYSWMAVQSQFLQSNIFETVKTNLFFFWLVFCGFSAYIIWLFSGLFRGQKYFQLGVLAASTAAAIFIGRYVLLSLSLPIWHYYQADGFYPQIFVVTVFILGLFIFSRAQSLLAQIIALCLLIAFLRFTYVLNLGDVCFGASIFLLVASVFRKGTLIVRAAGLLTSASLFAVGILVTNRLLAKSNSPGLSVQYDHLLLNTANLQLLGCCIGGLLLVCVLNRSFAANSPIIMPLALVLAICSASLIARNLYLYLDFPPTYYYLKHAMFPSILTHLCFIIISTISVVTCLQTFVALLPKQKSFVPLATSVLASAALWLLGNLGFSAIGSGYHAIGGYRLSFDERMNHLATPKVIAPLLIGAVDNRIRHILLEENKSFGGYWTSNWAQHTFMNEALMLDEMMGNLGNVEPSRLLGAEALKPPHERFFSGYRLDRTDTCFFYDPNFLVKAAGDQWGGALDGNRATFSAFLQNKRPTCIDYADASPLIGASTLCTVCVD